MASPSRPAVALNLTTNTPHNTRTEVNVGVLSILFSYGIPVGFDYVNGILAWEGVTKTQRKHLYQWRNGKSFKWVSASKLTQELLSSLQTEAEAIQLSATENGNMTERFRAQENDDLDEVRQPDELETEVDALDGEDDEDLDDDDLDEDEDEDDDLDDDDEDDDFDDEDEFAGDDEDDLDGDDDLKENEY